MAGGGSSGDRSVPSTPILLAGIGGGIELLLLWIGSLDSSPSSVTPYVTLFLCAHLLYILAVGIVLRCGEACPRGTLPVVIACSLLFSVSLLPSQPLFNRDIYRYLWDGGLVAQGINPFHYSPDNWRLILYRNDVYQNVEYSHLRTIYPPVAQLLFATSSIIRPSSVVMFKALVVAFHCASILLIIGLLRRMGMEVSRVIIYAWSPLLAKEFANTGHMDAFPIFFLLLSFYLLLVHRCPRWALFAMALSVLSKIFALLPLPFYLKRMRWRYACSVVPITIAAFYLPFAGAGSGLYEQTLVYSTYWIFNPGLFEVLRAIASPFVENGVAGAKVLIGAILAGVLLWLVRRDDGSPEALLRSAFAILSTFLVLTPAAYPWYFTWILPFVCFFPSVPWLYLTGTTVLSYTYYLEMKDIPLYRHVEYVPFFFLLALPHLARLRLFHVRVPTGS